MPTWKQAIADACLPPVRDALTAANLPFCAVDFDFPNCLIRVCVPAGTPDPTFERVEEVARAAGRVGAYADEPPRYPFTIHFQAPIHPVRVPTQEDGIVALGLRSDQLAELREAYARLCESCASVDVVATFAQGGMVPLQFVARANRNTFPNDAAFEEHLVCTQRRFHLFPGLLWTDDGANAVIFAQWMSAQPSGIRVLLFDTTFSGNAVGRIRNVVRQWSAEHAGPVVGEITVVGIVDKQRLGDKELANGEEVLTTRDGHHVPLRWSHVFVQSLLTEDQNDLVGYEVLRPLGQIDATWTAAVIELRDAAGILLDVIATRTLPAVMSDLLDGRHRVHPLDADHGAVVAAAGVLACIRKAAHDECDQLERALLAGLVDEPAYRTECRRVRAAEDGALKRQKRYFEALNR